MSDPYSGYKAAVLAMTWAIRRQVRVVPKLYTILSFLQKKGDLLSPETGEAFRRLSEAYKAVVKSQDRLTPGDSPSAVTVCARSFLPHEVYAAMRLVGLFERRGSKVSLKLLHEGPSQGDSVEGCDVLGAAAHVAASWEFWGQLRREGLAPVYVIESGYINEFYAFENGTVSVDLLSGTAASKAVKLVEGFLRGAGLSVRLQEHVGGRSGLINEAAARGFACIDGYLEDCIGELYYDVPVVRSAWSIVTASSLLAYMREPLEPGRYAAAVTGSVGIVYVRDELLPLAEDLGKAYSEALKSYRSKPYSSISLYFKTIREARVEHLRALLDLVSSGLETLRDARGDEEPPHWMIRAHFNALDRLRSRGAPRLLTKAV